MFKRHATTLFAKQKIRNTLNIHQYEMVGLVAGGCDNKLLQTGWLNKPD